MNPVETTPQFQWQDEWDPIIGFPSSLTEEMSLEEFNSAIPVLRDMTWNLQKDLESEWGLPVHGMQVWEEFSQGAEIFAIKIHWEGINAATSTLGKVGPI